MIVISNNRLYFIYIEENDALTVLSFYLFILIIFISYIVSKVSRGSIVKYDKNSNRIPIPFLSTILVIMLYSNVITGTEINLSKKTISAVTKLKEQARNNCEKEFSPDKVASIFKIQYPLVKTTCSRKKLAELCKAKLKKEEWAIDFAETKSPDKARKMREEIISNMSQDCGFIKLNNKWYSDKEMLVFLEKQKEQLISKKLPDEEKRLLSSAGFINNDGIWMSPTESKQYKINVEIDLNIKNALYTARTSKKYYSGIDILEKLIAKYPKTSKSKNIHKILKDLEKEELNYAIRVAMFEKRYEKGIGILEGRVAKSSNPVWKAQLKKVISRLKQEEVDYVISCIGKEKNINVCINLLEKTISKYPEATKIEQLKKLVALLKYKQKLDKIIMSGYIKKAKFRVFQSNEDGALCRMGRWDNYFKDYIYDGQLFFLYGTSNDVVADNEKYTGDLFYTGTYKYVSVANINKTVRSYAFTMATAYKVVAIKYNLSPPDILKKYASKDKSDRNTTNFSENNNDTPKGCGSGFVITKNGYILTNQHVVDKANKIQVKTSQKLYDAKLISVDKENDLALIKINAQCPPVSFSKKRIAALGETIFTVGFPRPSLQGFSPKITKGVISSLSGIQDDTRHYQIDAAIQPGNSGGPLADASGNVVGIICSKLNDAYVIQKNGDIAQNVNYAIKKSYIYAFLDSFPKIANEISEEKKSDISFEKAVDKINKSTVLIVVY